jgi:hypothetical protein
MKLKIITLSLLLLSTVSVASAQREEPRKFEFEVASGIVFPFLSDGIPGWFGFQATEEARYNFVPKFDVALQYSFVRFDRDYLLDEEYHKYRIHSLNAFFDYNWRPSKNLHLFAGLGLGCSFIEDEMYFIQGGREFSHPILFTVTPRFGFEMFNRVRFTVDFKGKMSDYSLWEYSYLGLNIGYVFGGGYK